MARVVVREPHTGTRVAPPLASPEATAFSTALLDRGWAAVFLPGEPARLGRLLLWQPVGSAADGGVAPAGVETESVELVLPHGRSVRRRRVEGYALPVALAVSALAGAQPPHAPHDSSRATPPTRTSPSTRTRYGSPRAVPDPSGSTA
ncbi:hypothetical protein RB628_24665 [Streptomyces sp. ADMS]|uniref:hypothetical protein n=1 Tax=Streptomyces sp. ADMS TaxID=3071415 RepID=UPI00296FA14B|nr:hypothetical protein [Streptomyces sp. ADMS]MDW4908445.1 hypothetical protein [Streptomyces sp. ADMS]